MLSDTYKTFYKEAIKASYDLVLKPVYEKIIKNK